MENWVLYAVVGLIIGAVIIFIWEEIELSSSSKQKGLHPSKQQHLQINQELESLVVHESSVKQEAIVSCYTFAVSQNYFSLKDIELHTKALQEHYKKSIINESVYKINFPEKEHLTLKPLKTLQILSIINEGLHNAAVHSQANFIFSIASIEDGKLNIITHDNGTGYDRKMVQDGNGIQKIKKATNELNAYLKLTSTLGNGTVVNVGIPTNSFDR